MGQQIVHRLLISFPALLGVLFLCFCLLQVVPADPAMTIGPTVELMLGAMLIAVPSGLALGTLAAVNRGRLSDRVIMACSVAGVSMPVFFIGLILIQYVGFKWALLPFTGRTGPVWDGGLPSLI